MFQQKLCRPEGNGRIYLKYWKRKTYNHDYYTQQRSHSKLMKNQKLYRQAEIKRIQHHQTSLTTNAEGTPLGKKHKRRKRPTENKPQTIKETVIGSYILTITLNVNGLNAPTKRHTLAGWMKLCACMHFHLPHHSAWHPPELYVIILYW